MVSFDNNFTNFFIHYNMLVRLYKSRYNGAYSYIIFDRIESTVGGRGHIESGSLNYDLRLFTLLPLDQNNSFDQNK